MEKRKEQAKTFRKMKKLYLIAALVIGLLSSVKAQKEWSCPDSIRWDNDSVYCYFSHPYPQFVPIKFIDPPQFNLSVMNLLVYRDGNVTPLTVMLRGIQVKYRGDSVAVYQSPQVQGDPHSSISSKDSIPWIWFDERGRVRLECNDVQNTDTFITTGIKPIIGNMIISIKYTDLWGRPSNGSGVSIKRTSYLRGVKNEITFKY